MVTPFVRSGHHLLPRPVLMDRAAKAAGGLTALGIEPGDSVALILKNGLPFLELTLAIGQIGAIAVPVNWHFAAPEVEYLLRDCDAKLIFVDQSLGDHLPASAVQSGKLMWVDDNSLACPYAAWRDASAPYDGLPRPMTHPMVYTSGTTGHPKGVRRLPSTPDQASAMARLRSQLYQMDAQSRVLVPGPLYHALPSQFALHALSTASYVEIMPSFDAETMLATIEREKITTIALAPIMFVRLLRLPTATRQRYDVSSLRWAIHAGGPCPHDVKRAMIAWWGPIIAEYYGGTETGPLTLATAEQWLAHPGTCGKPLENVELCVVDRLYQLVEAEASGEIYGRLHSYPDFTYHQDPQKREDVGLGHLVSLGDIGYQNADGYLFLHDRARDMVISGGVNIYPAEVENALFAIEGVADCAVFGIADAEYGEKLVAFVVSPDHQADDLILALRGQIAGYKIPKMIKIVDYLERDPSGKIRKHKLPALWEKMSHTSEDYAVSD